MALSNLRQFQDGVMLAEGEENRAYRVRAGSDVHAWLSAMTATERGDVLTRAFEAINPIPATTATLDGVTVLSVVSAAISQRTRNRLRWPAMNYPRTEALLAQGDVIRLDRADGKLKWRTVQGDVIRRDSLLKLLEAGQLDEIKSDFSPEK